jgi:hypothetical protein
MASRYSIRNIPTITACVLLAPFAVAAGAKADFYKFDVEDGSLNGAVLLNKTTTVREAKIVCRDLPTCKGFFHKGSPVPLDDSVVITFTDDELTTINIDETYTSYIKIETCTSTEFAHCPEDDGVKCCMSGLAIPRCGSKANCRLIAEKTECSDANLDVCPTMKGKPCCADGRCLLTNNCPKAAPLPMMEISIAVGVLMACLCAIALWLCCAPQSRSGEVDLEEGCIVKISTPDPLEPARYGVLVSFNDQLKQWNVRLRDGQTIVVDRTSLVLVKRPEIKKEGTVEMQQPLANQSIGETSHW